MHYRCDLHRFAPVLGFTSSIPPLCLVLESPHDVKLEGLAPSDSRWVCPDGKDGRLYGKISPNSEGQTGRKTLQQACSSHVKSVKIESIHLVPECCRFLLLPFPLGGLLCLSWFSLCSKAASLTRCVPVLPRRPRFSPEPIRGNVAPLAL